MWVKQNCLVVSIKYKIKNSNSKILIQKPECFNFNLLKPTDIIKYLKYSKTKGVKLIDLLLPHFFIIDGDYEIHFTDKGVIKCRTKNFTIMDNKIINYE